MNADIAGWAGTFLVLAAYFMISLQKLSAGIVYQLMNFFGSLGLLWLGFEKTAWPVVAVNGLWALIALVSLINILRKKFFYGNSENQVV